jgi:hypothetical protein
MFDGGYATFLMTPRLYRESYELGLLPPEHRVAGMPPEG